MNESIFLDVAQTATKINRDPSSITVCAATKKQSTEAINTFITYQNERKKVAVIGENYVQEFRDKQTSLQGHFEAHLIGHLQSNKIKDAVALFDCIQSIDSIGKAEKINTACEKVGKILGCFLQVNVSRDDDKSGCSVDDVSDIVEKILTLKSLHFRGLMTITRLYENPEDGRKDFQIIASLREGIARKFNLQSVELSMGMSDDFIFAIEEGATMIRVGSALFGQRN